MYLSEIFPDPVIPLSYLKKNYVFMSYVNLFVSLRVISLNWLKTE